MLRNGRPTHPTLAALWRCVGFIGVLLGPLQATFGQELHWVFFKDRPACSAAQASRYVSAQTLAARQAIGLALAQATDCPPASTYLAQLEQAAGVQVRTSSRWLNAASIALTPEKVGQVRNLPFVASVRPVRAMFSARLPLAPKGQRLGRALSQIGGGWLQDQKLTGEGVQVGLIDAGFGDADTEPELAHLFKEKRIKLVRDFEDPKHTSFFRKNTPFIDDHGTEVLSLVAGNNASDGQWGGAIHSQFVLARTDNALKEYRHEEDLWVQALEWMDSLGVRLINTSLGYGLGFDDPAQNHSPKDADGRTSITTRALNMAVREKGITVVVSAGNDGQSASWGIINMPADAEEAITVGATYLDAWQHAGYSGTGPEGLTYIKPDVAAFSLLGTSFSAPVITGAVACLMERYPNRKPKEYADALRASGHLHAVPNTYLGHGVPSLARAALALEGKLPLVEPDRLAASGQTLVALPNGEAVAVFHKKDTRNVLQQQIIHTEKAGPTLVVRAAGAAFTTLATPGHVWEIEWKN